MSTPANFNGARPVIDVNDAVMLLIDCLLYTSDAADEQ